MTETKPDLWKRLSEFEFDDPDAAVPFSARVARENNWSAKFTKQAIEEYKRFAYLAMVAGHGVTPSETIDKVWHEHLLYTEQYWKEFCAKALGTPLHHRPSKGGLAEREKFDGWYKKTLESYQHWFGHQPPTNIWPQPKPVSAPSKNSIVHAVVGAARRWLGQRQYQPVFLAVLSVGLLLGCASSGGGKGFSPLALSGNQFLAVYIPMMLLAFGLGAYLRMRSKESLVRPSRWSDKWDDYEMAYLAGGKARAMNTALVSLLHREILIMDDKKIEFRQKNPISPEDHPLEIALWEKTASGPVSREKLAELMEPEFSRLDEKLVQEGVIPSRAERVKAVAIPLVLILVTLLIGAAKLIVGFEQNELVGYLGFACAVTLLGGLLAFARPIQLTRAGEDLLEQIRSKHPASGRGTNHGFSFDSPMLRLAVGLYGLSILANGPLADLEKKLGPSSSSGCGGGGACGGCGGGGCGGGCGG